MAQAKVREPLFSQGRDLRITRGFARQRGFTLVELLVAISLIAVLGALLFPVFAGARAAARTSACAATLKQLSSALRLYTDEYDGWLPVGDTWERGLSERLRAGAPLRCPDLPGYAPAGSAAPVTPGALFPGYAYNGALGGTRSLPEGVIYSPEHEVRLNFPATTVTLCDSAFDYTVASNPVVVEPGRWTGENAGRRHRGGANYAFADGHVRWFRPEHVISCCLGQDGTRPSFQP